MSNSQQISSIVRQGLALVGIVFAVLTQSDSSLHLPAVVSAWMGVGGVLIIAIEHYLSDPSTGTSPTPAPTPVAVQTTTANTSAAAPAPAGVWGPMSTSPTPSLQPPFPVAPANPAPPAPGA